MHDWWYGCVCMCMRVLFLRGGCMFCVTFPAWVFSYILMDKYNVIEWSSFLSFITDLSFILYTWHRISPRLYTNSYGKNMCLEPVICIWLHYRRGFICIWAVSIARDTIAFGLNRIFRNNEVFNLIYFFALKARITFRCYVPNLSLIENYVFIIFLFA